MVDVPCDRPAPRGIAGLKGPHVRPTGRASGHAQGRIVEGARLELKSPELSARSGALLRAVIRATPATAAAETDQ